MYYPNNQKMVLLKVTLSEFRSTKNQALLCRSEA